MNDTVIVIDDSIVSNDTNNFHSDDSTVVGDESTVVNDTYSEAENTTDSDYVPDFGELHETSLFTRHQQLSDYVAYVVKSQSNELEPVSVSDAFSSNDASDWKLAMEQEMQSLDENRTWTLVDLPPGRKPIKSKWVFKIKRDCDGVMTPLYCIH